MHSITGKRGGIHWQTDAAGVVHCFAKWPKKTVDTLVPHRRGKFELGKHNFRRQTYLQYLGKVQADKQAGTGGGGGGGGKVSHFAVWK